MGILSQQPCRAGAPTAVSEEDLAHPLGSTGAAEHTHPNFCGCLHRHLVTYLPLEPVTAEAAG